MKARKPNRKKANYPSKQQLQKYEDFFRENVLELHQQVKLYDTFCNYAQKYAELLRDGKVKTSMIRKIYARILGADSVEEIKLLRPHFAYVSGRNERNSTLKSFMNLLDDLAKSMKLENDEHLKNFKQFMEAIVAYRKYAGDDDDK